MAQMFSESKLSLYECLVNRENPKAHMFIVNHVTKFLEHEMQAINKFLFIAIFAYVLVQGHNYSALGSI